MTHPVETERRGPVVLVHLARADAHNAMDIALLGALVDTLAELAVDDGARAIVLAGGERAFSVGGDLAWITSQPEGAGGAVHRLAGKLHQGIVEMRRMAKPVIGAIRGVAAGAGMSLALACDLRVLGRSSRLVLAYTSRGLSVDGGASFALPRLVGLARALEIAALDEPIPAEQALSWGLATSVTDDDRVIGDAFALAERLAERSPHAFGAAKRLLMDSFDTPLETQLEREREALARAAVHPDGAEGLAAFLEKREPRFRR